MDEIFTPLTPEKAKIAAALDHDIKRFLAGDINRELAEPEQWKGYQFPPIFSPAVAQRVYHEMKVEENTIFIGSYPKTGSNWFTEIVRQIIYGHDEKLYALANTVPFFLRRLETWKPEKVELFEHLAFPRKLFSTHLPEELVNFERIKRSKGKVIIVYRNPKDQVVSWYHFTQSNPSLRSVLLSSDWNQSFLDQIQGKHPTLSKQGEWYPEYLLGWNKHRGDENLIFSCFEDMKKDPQKEIKKLAEFLDVEISDDRASEIAQSTSFSKMKSRQDSSDDANAKSWKLLGLVRQGKVGSWKETFTVAQSELMDKAIEEKLSHTGIKFTYQLQD